MRDASVANESERRVLSKHELEATLHGENRDIRSGKLKDENPLDYSEEFLELCAACRKGDLSLCQRWIQKGANINARDRFDYTPLILASLCGHYDVVVLLLESGALCDRDTFQGERCLYNALNDKIRNLLLEYDYSKTRDPLQPYAAHITSLLHCEISQISDITLTTEDKVLHLHKFILAARSPYFAKKLSNVPETTTWRVSQAVPSRALEIAMESVYLGEVNLDLSDRDDDQAILSGIEKLCRQLEIGSFLEKILNHSDSATLSAAEKRVAHRRRQQERTEEVERGRTQIKEWFESSVLANQIQTDSEKADSIKWDRENSIFADVLLCAIEDDNDDDVDEHNETPNNVNDTNEHLTPTSNRSLKPNGIPIGPAGSASASRDPSPSSEAAQRKRRKRSATIIPAHRAMLIRSEYFHAMFSSSFKEAQPTPHLPVIPIDCSPAVLRIILTFLYTEDTSGITLETAIDVLFAADLLFIEKLKVKAATIISTLGNGEVSIVDATNARGKIEDDEVVDIYDVIRAGWDTRVHRLEEFGARYIAHRLERYIDDPDFMELVKESAARIKARQETDTVELIDDIRYYLSERFRLRFEDTGFDDMEEEEQQQIDESMKTSTVKTADDLKPIPADQDLLNGTDQSIDSSNLINAEGINSEQAVTGMGVLRTLDGEIAGDEFAQDAINYQILLGKIDALLEKLKIDA